MLAAQGEEPSGAEAGHRRQRRGAGEGGRIGAEARDQAFGALALGRAPPARSPPARGARMFLRSRGRSRSSALTGSTLPAEGAETSFRLGGALGQAAPGGRGGRGGHEGRGGL